MNPPLVPTVAETSVRPSGAAIETFVLQHVDVPIVTSVISRLTRRPATASNVTVATSPDVTTLTATGAPPGAIVGSAANVLPASADATSAAAPAANVPRTRRRRLGMDASPGTCLGVVAAGG